MKRLIKNIACLAGVDTERKHCLRGSEMATLNCVKDAWLLVDGDRFDSWGEMATMPEPHRCPGWHSAALVVRQPHPYRVCRQS